MVQAYQEALKQERSVLGELRLQYSKSENKIIKNIEKSQEDLYSHVRMLSQSKNIPPEQWVFDPSAYAFVKKPIRK
jgi:hypothetical protein